MDGAKNISLNPLDISGATSLLRNYLNALGHKPPLSDILENICKECEYNPLAIRISADLYAAGGDFNEIINKTKNDILSFSFSSSGKSSYSPSVIPLKPFIVSSNDTRTPGEPVKTSAT